MSDKLKDQSRGNQGGNSENPSNNNPGGGNPGGGNPGGGNPDGGNPGGGNPGGGNPGGGNPGVGNPCGGNPGGGSPGGGGGDQKIILHILIDGGRSFTGEFVVKQKLQVVVNKTLEHFGLTDGDKRELKRNDGTLLSDYSRTIEETGLRNEETLKFLLKKAPQPEGPKKIRLMKQWTEQYLAVYRSEIDTLQHGLPNFEFSALVNDATTNGRVVVKGKVKYGEGKEQLVRVVFPHTYPFVPPEVAAYQVGAVLRGGQVVQQEQPRMFNSNNQYRHADPLLNGKLCLFDEDAVWIPFEHGVALTIQQSVGWLEGVTSGTGLRKDQVVAESLPMLPNFSGQMIWYQPEAIPASHGGRLLLKRFKDHHYALLEMHAPIGDETKLIDCFPDGTALSSPKEDVITGRWFRVGGVPGQVIPLLSQGNNFEKLLQQVARISLVDLIQNATSETKLLIIAFYFPETNELHPFEVYYSKLGADISTQITYLLPKDLSRETFSRTRGLLDADTLAGKKVVAIGAGAIGSEALKEIATAGVGKCIMIDPETFDAGNSIRHAADLFGLGEKKVLLMKKLMQAKNPRMKIGAYPVRLFDLAPDLLHQIFKDADLVLDFTATKSVEYFLHHKVFVEMGKPVLQAASSRGGLTASILLMIPGRSACLECLKKMNADQVPVSLQDISELVDTDPDYGVCAKPAMPASGVDTREAALQAARITIQFLTEEKPGCYPSAKGHQLYWHGPAGGISVLTGEQQNCFEWELANIKGEKDCEHCKIKP